MEFCNSLSRQFFLKELKTECKNGFLLMYKCDLLKLALGGLAAGCCLLGQADALSKCSKAPPEQPEAGESKCGGDPNTGPTTCASCVTPDDCNDVSNCNESGPSGSTLRSKRQKAAKVQKPEEAECKKIY